MKYQVKHPESVVFHIKNSLEGASRTDFNDASFYLLNCSSLDPIMVLCFASFTCVSHFIVSRVLKAWKGEEMLMNSLVRLHVFIQREDSLYAKLPTWVFELKSAHRAIWWGSFAFCFSSPSCGDAQDGQN